MRRNTRLVVSSGYVDGSHGSRARGSRRSNEGLPRRPSRVLTRRESNQQDRKIVSALETHADDLDSIVVELIARVDRLELMVSPLDEETAQREREAYASLMLDVRARDPLSLAQPPRSVPIERAVDAVVDAYQKKQRGEASFTDFKALLPRDLRDAA